MKTTEYKKLLTKIWDDYYKLLKDNWRTQLP